MKKLGRNDSCHCGSGNKYKRCCLAKDEAADVSIMSSRLASAAITPQYFIEQEIDWADMTYKMLAQYWLHKAGDTYPDKQLISMLRLWHDYSSSERPIIKKAAGIAATLEYCLCSLYGYPTTQSQLAEKYEVSSGTISKRVHQILEFAKRLPAL